MYVHGDIQKKIKFSQLKCFYSDSLLNYFSQYGEVIDCVVMKNQQTGKSRGFGFVTFNDAQCVDTVLSAAPHSIDGRQVPKDIIYSYV